MGITADGGSRADIVDAAHRELVGN